MTSMSEVSSYCGGDLAADIVDGICFCTAGAWLVLAWSVQSVVGRACQMLNWLVVGTLDGTTYLHPLTNVPTKFQLPTPYSFQDIALTRFDRSRSLGQGQIKVTP